MPYRQNAAIFASEPIEKQKTQCEIEFFNQHCVLASGSSVFPVVT